MQSNYPLKVAKIIPTISLLILPAAVYAPCCNFLPCQSFGPYQFPSLLNISTAPPNSGLNILVSIRMTSSVTSSFERPPKLLLPPMQQRQEIPSLRNLNLPTPFVPNYHLPPMTAPDQMPPSPYGRMSVPNSSHYYSPPMSKYPSFPLPLKVQSPQIPQVPHPPHQVGGPSHLPAPTPFRSQSLSIDGEISYPSQRPKDHPSPSTETNKRKRRKAHEVQRLYKCNHESCQKAYGTLNHLNSHIMLQKHGQKRSPSEFKDLREELKRKRKLERASSRSNLEREGQSSVGSQDQYQQADHFKQPTSRTSSYDNSLSKDQYYHLNMLPPLQRQNFPPMQSQPRLY
ncbi:hypothetical protein OGAPHI_004063 [Ogataea philodendri]|uniref:C2H2-type domain-containing protein n=1 Tax=Ogataea philodendri TaxID=1378263 RepID=A0A9P8P6I7_9ASCO|nr:uncharacterized protein OGAPHI_004063 [Ogataea philodendri]KAH3665874.1 hypothetical protein OGAPHI_004063 [Ogataea philodendri]